MNLVLVTIDCLRADHLSCLGYFKKTTPNLDYLASGGALFRQAISVAPGTPFSFLAAFTSTYPLMYGGQLYVTNQRTALAQLLKEHGYHTAAFHSNPWLSSHFGYHHGFDTFDDGMEKGQYKSLPGKGKGLVRSILGTSSKLYKALASVYRSVIFVNPYVEAEALTRKAISWLRGNPNNSFLWMHYMDVHQPYLPRRRIISLFERHRLVRLNQKAQEGRHKPGNLSPEEVNELVDLYDAEVSYTDEAIGRLLHMLKRSKILDSTFVIITADHGQEFMEHGHYAHGLHLYDELIRVPLIITGPGLRGQVIGQQVSLLDLAPTILDLLKIKKPEAFLGNSLLSLMKGKVKAGNSEAISETAYKRSRQDLKKPPSATIARRIPMGKGKWKYICIEGVNSIKKAQLDILLRKISLRTDRWKYIYDEGKQDELYCLEDDPKETQSMISVRPKIATELRNKIMAHIEFEDKSIPSEEERIKARIKQLKGDRRI